MAGCPAQTREERFARVIDESTRLQECRDKSYGRDSDHLRAMVAQRSKQYTGGSRGEATGVSGMNKTQLQVGGVCSALQVYTKAWWLGAGEGGCSALQVCAQRCSSKRLLSLNAQCNCLPLPHPFPTPPPHPSVHRSSGSRLHPCGRRKTPVTCTTRLPVPVASVTSCCPFAWRRCCGSKGAVPRPPCAPPRPCPHLQPLPRRPVPLRWEVGPVGPQVLQVVCGTVGRVSRGHLQGVWASGAGEAGEEEEEEEEEAPEPPCPRCQGDPWDGQGACSLV
jgi:hypothetical protein